MVERGSTHHGGRLDDVLAEEVEPLVRSGHEARASDDRLHEPPADDEPTPDSRIAGGPHDDDRDGVLDLDEIEARSELAASLRPSAFPADRDALHEVALEQHAWPAVLEALASLPSGIRFVNVQQVWEMLGGEREQRGRRVAFVPAGTSTPAGAATSTTEPTSTTSTTEPTVEEHEPVVEAGPPPGAGPWWLGPVRTVVGLATLPLRIGIEVARGVEDRIRRR